MTGNLYGLLKAAGLTRTAKTFLHGYGHNEAHKMLSGEHAEAFPAQGGNNIAAVRQILNSKNLGAAPQATPNFIPGDLRGGMQVRMINGTPVYMPNNIADILKRGMPDRQIDNYPGYM